MTAEADWLNVRSRSVALTSVEAQNNHHNLPGSLEDRFAISAPIARPRASDGSSSEAEINVALGVAGLPAAI